MARQLTQDFAEKVRLPLNPVSRHEQVTAMIHDSEVVGDVVVLVNPGAIEDDEHYLPVVAIHPIIPVLGRRTLRQVAKSLDFLEKGTKF